MEYYLVNFSGLFFFKKYVIHYVFFFFIQIKSTYFFIQIKSAPKINCLMTTQILTLFQSAQL